MSIYTFNTMYGHRVCLCNDAQDPSFWVIWSVKDHKVTYMEPLTPYGAASYVVALTLGIYF